MFLSGVVHLLTKGSQAHAHDAAVMLVSEALDKVCPHQPIHQPGRRAAGKSKLTAQLAHGWRILLVGQDDKYAKEQRIIGDTAPAAAGALDLPLEAKDMIRRHQIAAHMDELRDQFKELIGDLFGKQKLSFHFSKFPKRK
jgi:hypothetical protein